MCWLFRNLQLACGMSRLCRLLFIAPMVSELFLNCLTLIISLSLPASIPLPECSTKAGRAVGRTANIIAQRMAYSDVSLLRTLPCLCGLRLLWSFACASGFWSRSRPVHCTLCPTRPFWRVRSPPWCLCVIPISTLRYYTVRLFLGTISTWRIATSVEESLIVPVIREAQSRSLGQIVTAMADLTDRARNRRPTPSEMSGYYLHHTPIVACLASSPRRLSSMDLNR